MTNILSLLFFSLIIILIGVLIAIAELFNRVDILDFRIKAIKDGVIKHEQR